MIQCLISGNILQELTKMLPDQDQDMPSYLNDLVTLMNILLPETEADKQNRKKLIVFGPGQAYPFSEDKESQFQKMSESIENLDTQKKVIYEGMGEDFFEFCAVTLLSRLFSLFCDNMSKIFREKCICIIDKILAITPQAIVQLKIDPNQLS